MCPHLEQQKNAHIKNESYIYLRNIFVYYFSSSLKGFPSWKLTLTTKAYEYLRIDSVFKKNCIFLSPFFLLFSTLKKKPSRSWRSVSGVKEKCVRGQGEVHWVSRKSVSGVKKKCIRGQGEVHQGSRRSAYAECVVLSWSTSPWPLAHFSLTPDALLLDLEGLFFRVKKSKKMVIENLKIFLKTLYILKYSYALVVKS